MVNALLAGGVVAVMEYEMTAAGGLPQTEVGRGCGYWICEAFRRSGLDPSLGARLGLVLRDAGLVPTVLGLQGFLEPTDPAGPRFAAETVRTLLPVIEKTGIATAAEIGIDTLEARLAEEIAREALTEMRRLLGVLRQAGDLATTLLGPSLAADSGEWGTYAWSELICATPGLRLCDGTEETHKNVIAERRLDLPREPFQTQQR